MKVLCILVSFFLSTHLFAASQARLMRVTHTMSDGYGHLDILLEKNSDIKSFDYKMYDDEGEYKESIPFSNEDVINGTILKRGLAKKYFTVKSENYTPHQGGDIFVRFPSNVFKGEYTSFYLNLYRQGDEWFIAHEGHGPFKHIHFIVKSVVVPVGVGEVVFK